MGEKIVVGPINKGLKTDRTAFVIDNDSFPVILNAYQWRGRVKRKRGTSLLNRLKRYFNSAISSYGSTTSFNLVAGAGNLLTAFSLQTNGNIVPGSVTLTDTTAGNTYTDNLLGVLTGVPAGTGTINYATGAITITGGGGDTINAVSFNYYPDLPVMGLEDFVIPSQAFPGTIAFDTVYSYNIVTSAPYSIYDVSFYKNPPTATYAGYTQKTNVTPTSWNGQDYQQFWTVNYQGALWATNGITVPFTTTNIGMQFKPIIAVTVLSPTTANLQITGHGLVVGDFVFVNEVVTTTGINFQTGYVTTVTDANNVIVTFPNATLTTNGTGGIAQYLTNRSDVTKDGIRWYDGDPTNGNATTPTLNGRKGWVNFAPPLSQSNFSIADLPAAKYYLVGARMIIPFKDRLLFLGPVVQTSSANSQVYLQDTVIYSQNGTPYYTASYTNTPSATVDTPASSTNVFNPILVPDNQTATSPAYFEDITGFGGFITAGLDEPINSVSSNEDVLITGLSKTQARLVYSGNDIVPFNFFVINSELGTSSTFSAINTDQGILSRGSRGYVITGQTTVKRFDLDIPDEVFEINLLNNGTERICAQRDFINEWIYFTYPVNTDVDKFPNQTLQYNYRDDSWGIFNESYTTYGSFRKVTGNTWATIGLTFPTWASWNEPWNSGSSTLEQPLVIGGNQQGFVIIRDDGTNEATSLFITNISFPVTITGVTQAASAVVTANNTFVVGQRVTITGVVGMTQLNGNTYNITAVTPTTFTISVNSTGFGVYISGGIATPPTIYSPNHGLSDGDYIVISGVIGTVGPNVNNQVFSVENPTTNDFSLNPQPNSGTYIGGGLIKKMYVPFIQTKQFPVAWGMARKTRLGPQQYLLTRTDNSQITLLIFLSQNSDSAYNDGPIIPDIDSINDSLIYSSVLYTCTESANLGLTHANTNLQMISNINTAGTNASSPQSQIWHRMNTSLIGDTVQIGFTMSDAQMRSYTGQSGSAFAITGATKASQCVLTCSGAFSTGQLVTINNVVGMSQLNGNTYYVISSNSTTVTINVDSTNFNTYISGGSAIAVSPINQFAEVELHSFILDTNPSQMLA